MSDHHARSHRRLKGVAAGVGIIALGVLTSAVAEIVDSPLARADEYSQIVDNIQAVEALGQADLGAATSAYTAGDNLQGLYDTFVGLDDTNVAPPSWLLLGGFDALSNVALPSANSFDFDDLGGPPASWSAAVAEVTSLTGYGDTLLTDATEAFAAGDPSGGLFDSIGVVSVFDVIEPEVLAMGLASGF